MICVLVMSKAQYLGIEHGMSKATATAATMATAIVTAHVYEACSSTRDMTRATAGCKVFEGMS